MILRQLTCVFDETKRNRIFDKIYKWLWMAFFLVPWIHPTIWRWKIAQKASTSRAPAGVWVGLCWKIFRLLPLPFKMIFDNSDALRLGYNLPMLFMLIAFPTNNQKSFFLFQFFGYLVSQKWFLSLHQIKKYLIRFLKQNKSSRKKLIKNYSRSFAFEES